MRTNLKKNASPLYFYDIEYALENIIWFLLGEQVSQPLQFVMAHFLLERSQIKPITTFHIWKSHYHKQTRESERLITEIAMRKIVHNNKIAWPNSFACYYNSSTHMCARLTQKRTHRPASYIKYTPRTHDIRRCWCERAIRGKHGALRFWLIAISRFHTKKRAEWQFLNATPRDSHARVEN